MTESHNRLPLMGKLGPHVILLTDGVRPFVAAAPIVKALDDPTPLKLARSARVLVFRAYFPDQDITKLSPQAAADVILGRLGGFRDPRLYVELLNECYQYMAWGFADYVAWTRQAAEILHRAGLKVAGFSFSTGTPKHPADPGGAEEWQYLKAQGYAGVDAIAVHEYWGNQGFTGWHALRYRAAHQVLGEGHPPFIVTECGRDAVEGGQGGWKRDGIPADQYARELLAYEAELEKDPYVLGATVFTSRSQDPTWDPFAIEEVAPYLLAAAPPANQSPKGGETMALKDQFPDLYAAWTGAGGDEEHFFAHLVGIGALPPTPENLLRVIQALKGDLAGLEEAVKRLPLA